MNRPSATRINRVAALTAAFVLLSVSFVPVASAQENSATVHFFAHVFDVGRANPMPMNTEFPHGEADWSAGYGGTCTNAVDGVSCESYAFNEAWFVSSAGFVDITDRDEFSYDKLHNERGLTKNIMFDTGKSVTATWYMSADAHGWPVIVCNPNPYLDAQPDLDDAPYPPICFNWDPGHLPSWQVEATLYGAVLGEHGSGASEQADIMEAYNDGRLEVIAQGVSTPQDVTSLEAAGYDTVWQFDIDLGAPQMRELPKEMSLIWRVQWWSLVNGQPVLEDNVLSWNVNSGEFYPPKVSIPVRNAFDVELVLPQFIHNKLVIHGILNTPWGSYDVDPRSVQLTLERDGQTIVEPERIQAYADYSVAHGGHYAPVNVTYVWDYQGDGVPPGDYEATITASNHQQSASATCSATFRILPGGGGEVVEVGRCGTVSEGAEEFVGEQTGGGDAGDGGSARLPVVTLSEDTTPVEGAGSLVLALVAALGLVVVRRWRR